MRRLAVVGLMLALAACGGGQAPATAVVGASSLVAQSSSLSTRPKSVTFASGSPVTVTIVGGTAPYAIVQSNPEIADVSAATQSGSTWTFTVGAVAGGRTQVTVTDARGATAGVPVSEMMCLPPIPAVAQFYPPSGARGVSTGVGGIFVQTAASSALRDLMPNFYARLLGSDGSVAIGGRFESAVPPPLAGADASRRHAYWRASLPKLDPHVTYRVQFASAALRCLPPAFTGDFTTR